MSTHFVMITFYIIQDDSLYIYISVIWLTEGSKEKFWKAKTFKQKMKISGTMKRIP